MKTALTYFLCIEILMGLSRPAYAQLQNTSSAFLEYLDKAQGPSDYIIKRFPNQKLMSTRLIGGVQKPGFYQIPEKTGLLSLISYSGGALPTSDIRSVTIWRQDTKEAIDIDLEKVLHDPKASDPTVLPNDVIYIREKQPLLSSDTMSVVLVTSTVAAIILSAIAISDRIRHPNP